MRSGLVAVPVNFKFPRPTVHFIVKDCGARLVFCDGARRADVPPGVPAYSFDCGVREIERYLDPRYVRRSFVTPDGEVDCIDSDQPPSCRGGKCAPVPPAPTLPPSPIDGPRLPSLLPSAAPPAPCPPGTIPIRRLRLGRD